MIPKKIVTDNPKDALQKYTQKLHYAFEPIKQGLRLQCLIKDKILFNGKVQQLNPQISLFHKKFKYIIDGLKRLDLPKNTLLDGTLVLENSSEMKDILRFYKQNPENMNKLFDKFGRPVFIISDVIYFDGRDLSEMPLIKRRKIIDDNIIDMEQIKKSKIYFHSSYKSNQLNDMIGKSSIFHLRRPASSYHFNKSNACKILKFLKMYQVILIDAFETPKREGECCSFSIGLYLNDELIEIQKVGAISDASLRRDLCENKDSYKGRVVEIKALDKNKISFLEPQYYRMRFDIKPENCKMED